MKLLVPGSGLSQRKSEGAAIKLTVALHLSERKALAKVLMSSQKASFYPALVEKLVHGSV